MKEADLQAGIVHVARTLGYRVAHFAPAQVKGRWMTPVAADGKGFPDLVMVRPVRPGRRGHVVFAEVKGRGGRLSAEQQAWLDDLQDSYADVTVAVITPADWPENVKAMLA